jgi:hypothetical protein
VTWSSLQTEFLKRTSGKNASGEPSTKDGTEAVRFSAFSPPSSPLDRPNVVVLLLIMNNQGLGRLRRNQAGVSRAKMPSTQRRIALYSIPFLAPFAPLRDNKNLRRLGAALTF